ncbi:MAG: FAD-binding oxidoreductase [bacterium]
MKEFILVNKKEEAENITSLFLEPTDGAKYEYIPGQYVKIKPTNLTRGKSYTISSVPGDKFVRITIKRKGEVSSALVGMSVGEKILIDGPYGRFYPNTNLKNIVMLAGGVGITPFMGMIKDKITSNFDGDILLFYSNKTVKQTPFFDELNNLSKENPIFKIVHCLTEEKTAYPFIKEYSRIDENIIKKYVNKLEDRSFYICGSVGFTDDMWKLLKGAGITEENIFTETFY